MTLELEEPRDFPNHDVFGFQPPTSAKLRIVARGRVRLEIEPAEDSCVLAWFADAGGEKAALVAALAVKREVPRIAPNVEGVLRQRVELLEETLAPAKNANVNESLTEKGRAALRDECDEPITAIYPTCSVCGVPQVFPRASAGDRGVDR